MILVRSTNPTINVSLLPERVGANKSDTISNNDDDEMLGQ